MTQWIETKLRYNKLKENGVVKKVTETYLVEALSVTEAEAQITREMQPYISGEFTVTAAKKSKIAEVITTDGEGFWYKLRVMFISFNERTGAAKLTPHDFMVQARDIEEAIAILKEDVNLLVDYKLAGLPETPVMDVFPIK